MSLKKKKIMDYKGLWQQNNTGICFVKSDFATHIEVVHNFFLPFGSAPITYFEEPKPDF